MVPNNSSFTHLCLEGITKFLSSHLEQLTLELFTFSNETFHGLIAAISASKLKHLKFSCDFDFQMAKSLARLLIQTNVLEEFSVGRRYNPVIYRNDMDRTFGFGLPKNTDCNAASILVNAMLHSRVKKLYVMNMDKNCIQTIEMAAYFTSYLRNRVFFPPKQFFYYLLFLA